MHWQVGTAVSLLRGIYMIFFLTNGMLWSWETCFLKLYTSAFLQGMQVQMVQFSKEKGCACVSRLNSSFLYYFNFKVKIYVGEKR